MQVMQLQHRQRHECQHREQRDDRLVAGRLGVAPVQPQVPLQVPMADNAIAIDERLRRGVDAMLGLERLVRAGVTR